MRQSKQLKKNPFLSTLQINRVNSAILMCCLDVRVDMRSLLGHVLAVRTLEPGQFSTLVSLVSVQSTVPLVGLAADLTAELASTSIKRSRCFQTVLGLQLQWICKQKKQRPIVFIIGELFSLSVRLYMSYKNA